MRGTAPVAPGYRPTRSGALAVAVIALLLVPALAVPAGTSARASTPRPAPSSHGTAPAMRAAVAPGPLAGPASPTPDGAPVGVAVNAPIGTGSVPTGSFPYGGAYDPATQAVYVANQAANNVTVFNGTTGAHIADIAMTADPLGAAYVPWNRLLYVIVETSKSIEVVNTTTNTVNATIALAGDPEYIAYDPDNQQLYMTVWTSYTIPLGLQAVNTTTNTASPAIHSGFDAPYCLTVDTANDTVWVENLNNDTITVVNGANDTVATWVKPGPQPTSSTLSGGIVYSPVGDQVFVVNYASVGTVNVLGASNYSLLRSAIPVGAYAYGASATYDPASESVYVASYYTNTTTVISAVNDTISHAALTMLGGPWVGIFDPTTGGLFFLQSELDAAAWIFGGIAVDFTEEGLALASPWTVALNGTGQTTSASTAGFVAPVGSFPYALTVVPGYLVPHPSGTVAVPSSPVAPVTVSFAFEVAYSVRFAETGLPVGSEWSVDLNGSTATEPAGTGAGFTEPNGSYAFTVTTSAAGYGATLNRSGTATVDGRGVGVAVAFGRPSYVATFSESGLPGGTSWWINLTGGASTESLNPTLSFAEPNGTYPYTVATADKRFVAQGANLSVRGGPVDQSVTFAVFGYMVTFQPVGLPTGMSWTVTLGTATLSGVGDISFADVPNGTTAFNVGSVTGYQPTPSSGSIMIAGHGAAQPIDFAASNGLGTGTPTGSAGSSYGGLTPLEAYAVIGAVAALVVVGLAVLVLRRPRRPGPPSAEA